jgi:hypothetical protein
MGHEAFANTFNAELVCIVECTYAIKMKTIFTDNMLETRISR